MLVLVALASFADNETGECWPSQATLAERTKLSERRVRVALKWLEDNHFLSRRRRKGVTSSQIVLTWRQWPSETTPYRTEQPVDSRSLPDGAAGLYRTEQPVGDLSLPDGAAGRDRTEQPPNPALPDGAAGHYRTEQPPNYPLNCSNDESGASSTFAEKNDCSFPSFEDLVDFWGEDDPGEIERARPLWEQLDETDRATAYGAVLDATGPMTLTEYLAARAWWDLTTEEQVAAEDFVDAAIFAHWVALRDSRAEVGDGDAAEAARIDGLLERLLDAVGWGSTFEDSMRRDSVWDRKRRERGLPFAAEVDLAEWRRFAAEDEVAGVERLVALGLWAPEMVELTRACYAGMGVLPEISPSERLEGPGVPDIANTPPASIPGAHSPESGQTRRTADVPCLAVA